VDFDSPLALGAFGFVAGLGAFFAPCAFSLFPGYVSYYLAAETAGGDGERLGRSLRLGLTCAAGSIVFFLLVGAAITLIVAAHLVIHRTKLGRAMRATFQDADTAALMGVRIGRIHTVTFALGSGLAAAAGALLGPIFLVYPSMGDLASLKAFSVVILGGLGSLWGATFGGLILGVAEELGAGYVSSGYRDAVGFVIIILVLLLRPSGLFARSERVG